MKKEYENLSDRERMAILEKKGTLLSDEEEAEMERRLNSPMAQMIGAIDEEEAEMERRLNSPMAQMIGAIGSRMPQINKRADGTGLCKVRKPKPGYFWHGEDSKLAIIIDEIIEKHQQMRGE